MKKIALFPGSFDPFTKGHESVIAKALPLFDEIIIGIGINSSKNYYFDTDKRLKHITEIYSFTDKIKVQTYQKLTIEFCKDVHATYILRGLRDTKDFEYEKAIAQMNLQLSGIETVFFLTSQEHGAINSSIIREMHLNQADISPFVTSPELLV